MVRAAVSGAIDFRQADPFDTWWRRRLHWILEEIDNQEYRKLTEIQHRHWVTVMGNGLNEEGWDKAYDHAQITLKKLMQLTFPWHKDVFTSPVQSEREDVLASWRAEWGYPGEPKYDAMVENLNKLFDSIGKSNIRPKLE